ncbi:hypothetical protein TNCV_4238171 [Trichonephila clavipes]|nr:hypothetical protein TNCV_4238171 [Trichonephila clavipes]
MESAECMGGPQASNTLDVVLVVQCTSNVYDRGATVKSNTTQNHDTRRRNSVVMHKATVQPPLTTVLKTQIRPTHNHRKHKQDSLVNTLPFHSVVHFHR